MLSLPPSPPPPFTSPPQNHSALYPLKQMLTSKQVEKQRLLIPDLPYSNKIKLKRLHRSNPIIWCTAVLCLIFSILLIFFGIATLIIFLDIKPRSPVFYTPTASLSVVYINSPELLFNEDFVFVANFSNPNPKLNVRFEYLDIDLYFLDSLIAAQALQPFTQTRRDKVGISSPDIKLGLFATQSCSLTPKAGADQQGHLSH